MTTATFPAFVDALKTALAARPALAGVTVTTAPLGDEMPPEGIEVIDCDTEVEWGALGATKQDEDYAINGVVFCVKPGGGDDIAKEARDRTAALLDELKSALTRPTGDPTLQVSGVLHARVSAERWAQFANDDGRVCSVQFRISVRARI